MHTIIRSRALVCLVVFVVLASAPTARADAFPVYTRDNAPPPPEPEELPLKEAVSQHGITWTFEEPVRVGRFINGDYWVVGPVTVEDISPRPLWGEEVGELIDRGSVRESRYEGRQARHGSVLNVPVTGAGGGYNRGGYDSRLPSGRYDPELFAHLPITMEPGDALVSTISRPNEEITRFSGQHVQPVRVAAVLNCVAEPLPPDAFRPSYTDSAGSEIYLARNLDREWLLTLPRPRSAPETLDGYTDRFRKPWLDTVCFGFAAPRENMPRYGQQFAERVGEATLLLQLDYPQEEKEPLLVNLVQVGIDLWGVARAGYRWHAHGGLYSGRKWSILFAGLMLDCERMQAPQEHAETVVFHEDEQTALGPYTYGDETFERSWTGSRSIFLGHSPYLSGRHGDRHWERGWGPIELYHPRDWPEREDGLPASEGYRRSNTSRAWVGQALAARIMRVESVWNHDAFFAYVDRWMTQDDTPQVEALKEAGFRDMTDREFGRWPRQGDVSGAAWVRELWETYRDDLPAPAKSTEEPPAPPADETWR